jgi:hypothetical protein
MARKIMMLRTPNLPKNASSIEASETSAIETIETVGAQLQQDTGEHDRAGGGRLDVRIRQPRMKRPHRNLDRKAQREGKEQKHLQRPIGRKEPDVLHENDIEISSAVCGGSLEC